MNASEAQPGLAPTSVKRASDRELVVTRTFDAPPRLVFQAWTRPELLMRWWMPRSIGIPFLSCEIDPRTGGGYRFVFANPESGEPTAFFGRYIEITAPSRMVWTNDEEGEGLGAITTVTFEALGDQTRVVMRDLHPTKESLDAAIASGSTSGFDESFAQLDEVLGET